MISPLSEATWKLPTNCQLISIQKDLSLKIARILGLACQKQELKTEYVFHDTTANCVFNYMHFINK